MLFALLAVNFASSRACAPPSGSRFRSVLGVVALTSGSPSRWRRSTSFFRTSSFSLQRCCFRSSFLDAGAYPLDDPQIARHDWVVRPDPLGKPAVTDDRGTARTSLYGELPALGDHLYTVGAALVALGVGAFVLSAASTTRSLCKFDSKPDPRVVDPRLVASGRQAGRPSTPRSLERRAAATGRRADGGTPDCARRRGRRDRALPAHGVASCDELDRAADRCIALGCVPRTHAPPSPGRGSAPGGRMPSRRSRRAGATSTSSSGVKLPTLPARSAARRPGRMRAGSAPGEWARARRCLARRARGGRLPLR